MNWEDRIVCDPNILLGKPTIKGTRLSVAFILERLADGWTEKMLYENYPRLTPADLQAIFAFASNGMNIILDHLNTKTIFEGAFTVLTGNTIRQRNL